MYRLGNRILTMGDKLFRTIDFNPIWSGLTYYWRFDENTGTAVNDSMKNLNGSVSSNTIWTTGKKNSGIQINSKRFISEPWTIWSSTQPYSVSAWVKLAYGDGQVTPIISNINGNTQCIFDIYLFNTGQLLFSLMNDYFRTVIVVNSFVTDNNWHNLVFTYNGDKLSINMKAYRDGNLITPSSYGNNLLNHAYLGLTNLQIGSRNNYTYSTNSIIDEVGVWNRVLSQAEVTALYNSGNGLFY